MAVIGIPGIDGAYSCLVVLPRGSSRVAFCALILCVVLNMSRRSFPLLHEIWHIFDTPARIIIVHPCHRPLGSSETAVYKAKFARTWVSAQRISTYRPSPWFDTSASISTCSCLHELFFVPRAPEVMRSPPFYYSDAP